MSKNKLIFFLIMIALIIPLVNQNVISASEIIENEKLIIERVDGRIALEPLKEKGLIRFNLGDSRYTYTINNNYLLINLSNSSAYINDELVIAEKRPLPEGEKILIDGKIAGRFLEEAGLITGIKENSIKTEIEPQNSGDTNMELNIMTEQEANNLKVNLVLQNKSERNRRLSFNTGQKYEIEIYNQINGEKGDKIYQWSRGQLFTQALEELNLSPEEKKEWQVNIPLSQLDVDQDYIIKAWITDRDKTGSPVEKNLEF